MRGGGRHHPGRHKGGAAVPSCRCTGPWCSGAAAGARCRSRTAPRPGFCCPASPAGAWWLCARQQQCGSPQPRHAHTVCPACEALFLRAAAACTATGGHSRQKQGAQDKGSGARPAFGAGTPRTCRGGGGAVQKPHAVCMAARARALAGRTALAPCVTWRHPPTSGALRRSDCLPLGCTPSPERRDPPAACLPLRLCSRPVVQERARQLDPRPDHGARPEQHGVQAAQLRLVPQSATVRVAAAHVVCAALPGG